jgi:membrane protease YdiL (CAAX protease family)
MYVLLFGFGLLVVAVICAVAIVHRRGVPSLIGPWRQTAHQFWRVCAGLACLYGGLLVLPPWDLGGPLVANLPIGLWLALLPISLLAVLVQVTGEEVLFRGYLQQQLAARFASSWVFLWVPSVLFGAGHYAPIEAGENAWIIALWAVMFGVLMADITARAGTLGPAIALHFANNIAAMLIISVPDSLSGLALYVTPFPMTDVEAMRAWLPVDFALMWISWLVARIAIRR